MFWWQYTTPGDVYKNLSVIYDGSFFAEAINAF